MTGDQEQETGAVLRTLLTVIPPTGTSRDKRIRRAMAAAAKALENDRDELTAVRDSYQGRGSSRGAGRKSGVRRRGHPGPPRVRTAEGVEVDDGR